jgi:hypothetical protein
MQKLKIIPYAFLRHSEPWNPDPNFFRISGSESVTVGTLYIQKGSAPRTKSIKSMAPLLFYSAFVSYFFTTYEISIEILSRLQSIPDPSAQKVSVL